MEKAVLCWAGNGITGAITGDLAPSPGGNLFGAWLGRTVPYACNVQNVKLFFTSDDGTFVYDPLAHWVWGGGWSALVGALDFAGGTVVHISSGFAALALTLVIGKRIGFGIGVGPIYPSPGFS
jgi:hypothetical protein